MFWMRGIRASKKCRLGGRYKEFEAICGKYRGINGTGPDCAIAVSGGKAYVVY